MLESPPYRVLSLSAHRVLSRIQIEHGHHAGKHNGRLPVRYEDFAAYGIDRHSIGPAIRELAALGFIEVTEQGLAGNADFRRPNKFRITFHPTQEREATNEWRLIKTFEEAETIAMAARKSSRKTKFQWGKNQFRWGNLTPKIKTLRCWNPTLLSRWGIPHYCL
jgi:hypothetical protein